MQNITFLAGWRGKVDMIYWAGKTKVTTNAFKIYLVTMRKQTNFPAFGKLGNIKDGGRIGIAAQALGIAEGAMEEAVNFTKSCVQFEQVQ